jgi:tetratricopeptide (TPR) repeat protein
VEEHRLAIEALANAARTVTRDDTDSRRKLATEIVRLADRMRVALPSASPDILQSAGQGLMRLGATELAWGYFTTPLAGRGNDANAWDDLADRMAQANRLALAADAKLIAAQLWPDDIEVAREAGEMLERANRIDEAILVYRHALTRKGRSDWDRRETTEIADRLKALTGEEVQLPDRLED